MKYFKLVILILFSFTLFGCGRARVWYAKQRSEEEVLEYVNKYISDNYSDVTVEYKGKEKTYIHGKADFCLPGCDYSQEVKGGYQYNFMLTDNTTNDIGSILYIDPSISKEGMKDEQLLDYYSKAKNVNYSTQFRKKLEKYVSNGISKSYHVVNDKYDDRYYNFNVIVEFDFPYTELTMPYMAALDNWIYDIYRIYKQDMITLDLNLMIKFKGDKEARRTRYGDYLKRDEEKQLNINFVNDYSDHFNLRDYKTEDITDGEWNKMLNDFNNYMSYYIYSLNKVEKYYNSEKTGYFYRLYFTNFGGSNREMQLVFVLDETTGKYNYKSYTIYSN